MRRLWGALVVVALWGCDPELNDPECAVTAECSFRPGTVCSPEGWCVVPEAVRVDMAVLPMPDMRRPDPVDVGVDLAVVDALVDAGGGVDGGVDFAVDGGVSDGAVGDPDLDLTDGGPADLEPADLEPADVEPADVGPIDGAAGDGETGDAVVGDAVFIEDAAMP